MTLTELRYLVTVAQERHFGRAAERCFVTQPVLSLAIQKLEESLGATIFERRKHQITLTPLGEEVMRQAQRVLEEAEQINVIVAQGKDQLIGPFKLGVLATVGPYVLPDLIPLLLGEEEAHRGRSPRQRKSHFAACRPLFPPAGAGTMSRHQPLRPRRRAGPLAGDDSADGRLGSRHHGVALQRGFPQAPAQETRDHPFCRTGSGATDRTRLTQRIRAAGG